MLDRLEKLLEWGGTRRKVALLSVSGLALLMSMLGMEPLPFEISWIAIVLCGVPIVLEAVLGLATAWDIKADVLVSVALVASVIIGEDFAAAEIAFIMQLGELLEELTVARARKGIERLVRLTPATARKVEGTREEVIPAEEVRIGDILRVLPGETIPADGVILSGHTSVNQSVMTGEPLPIDKEAGDEVSSGTVNQFGTFDMKAARTGKDSSIQRMVRLVQSADAGKAKIVRLADRWATWIVAIALVSAGGAWMATGELIRAVTILVVFCPCALVLATPTAVMAAIGNATRHGFLVRKGMPWNACPACPISLSTRRARLPAVLRAWRPCAVSCRSSRNRNFTDMPPVRNCVLNILWARRLSAVTGKIQCGNFPNRNNSA